MLFLAIFLHASVHFQQSSSIMAYKNQVGGRAEIIKVFGDHLLKPTTFYEVESYLKMSRSIADIAPDCCYIFSVRFFKSCVENK